MEGLNEEMEGLNVEPGMRIDTQKREKTEKLGLEKVVEQ